MIGPRCDDGEELGTSSIRSHSTLEDSICPPPHPDAMFGDGRLGVGGARHDSLHFAASGQRAAGGCRGHLA